VRELSGPPIAIDGHAEDYEVVEVAMPAEAPAWPRTTLALYLSRERATISCPDALNQCLYHCWICVRSMPRSVMTSCPR
jgi:hypothetical protein